MVGVRRLLPWALVLILVLTVGLAGCGKKAPEAKKEEPKAEEPVTITFWHAYNTDSPENKTLNEVVIPAFQKKYPNITVKSVVMPSDGLHDQLVTAVSGGKAPDVMRMDIIWTPEFAKLGALVPLDDMPGFNEIKDAVFPGPLATNLYKGKHYGVPLDTNTMVLVYNPEILKTAGFEGPPKTIDELKAIAAKLKGKKDVWTFAPGGPYPWQFLPWFWSLGGTITDDNITKASGFLNSEAGVAALQTMVDLNKSGAIGPAFLGGQPDTWGGFKGGKYAMIVDGPWFFAIMGKELGDKAVGAPMPAGPGGSISVVGGENTVMFSTTKNKEAAWKFIQFLLSEEAQLAMAKTGQIPVLKSAANSDVIKSVAYYAPYFEQLKTAKPRTPHPAWNKMDKILNDAFEAAIRGKASPKDALDKAAKEIDALLAQ